MAAPRYYCPPGVSRPEHIRALAPVQLVPGAGLDAGGGMVYGGGYDAELGWQRCEPGWWVCLDGVTPRDLLRSNAIAGFYVDGWAVPQILDGDVSRVGYWTAQGFTVPAPLVPLVDGLRAQLDARLINSAELATLATALLAVNHHVTIHELGLMRALTTDATVAMVQAGCGVPPGFRQPPLPARDP